jgi:hypothetical protein
VLHAIMEEIVLIMDHHSHAYARLDIVVIAAKVNIIYKNIYFFYFPIFIPESVLWNRGEAVVKFKRGSSLPQAGKLVKFKICYRIPS